MYASRMDAWDKAAVVLAFVFVFLWLLNSNEKIQGLEKRIRAMSKSKDDDSLG